ncbi:MULTISPECIES: hypothetical protein [unclassified Pseudomonas]|uniref:hypothetical protein n=1 Tax=unclassified Pseudomonas TaxID=196821 RepID=UPI0014871F08|nr:MULTISPECIES: hypothetical protein [unclassified Pseudomonas]
MLGLSKKTGVRKGSRFFCLPVFSNAPQPPVGASLLAIAVLQTPSMLTDTPLSRASSLPHLIPIAWVEAAEKRQPAETDCRFSGIAALPMPAKAPVYGLFESGTTLAMSIVRKFWSPEGFQHEHQFR